MADAPDIYVDLESTTFNFIHDAKKVPPQFVEPAKQAMKKAAERELKGASGITTAKKGNGYALHFLVKEIIADGKGAKCTVSADITRYPSKESLAGVILSATAAAQGMKPDRAVADCLDSIVEDLVTKRAVPAMKKHVR